MSVSGVLLLEHAAWGVVFVMSVSGMLLLEHAAWGVVCTAKT